MSPFRWKDCGCSVYSVSRASVFGRIFLYLVLKPKGHLLRRRSGLGNVDDEGKAHLAPAERGKATRKSVGAVRAADEVRFPWPGAAAVFLSSGRRFPKWYGSSPSLGSDTPRAPKWCKEIPLHPACASVASSRAPTIYRGIYTFYDCV